MDYVHFLCLLVNFVSTSLGHRVPRYLVPHYPGCVCEGVSEVRVTFESTDQAEQITLPSVGRPHPTH